MLEWIITSCVLIGIVLLVRLCLKNRISLRLRYALWLIVLVRLLVPVNFFNSSMSVMNVVPESATVAELQQPEIIDTPEQTPTQPITDTPVTQVPILPVNPTPITPVTPEVEEPVQLPQAQLPTQEAPPEKSFSVTLLLQIIWIAGIAITGGVFLFANIRFALRLKRTREAQNADCPLRVYRTAVIDTPCLFGIFRPAIYLTEQAGEDEGRHHILTHEMTHYKHLDHIWGLLRCLCLALHWYNPLVWVAAICSRRDSELACDEAVIKQLGEDSRAEYGKTLIRMTCTKQNAAGIFTTATTMTGSKKTIKNRIKLIVKHPQTALYAVICLVLIAAIAVGCTFTGAKTKKEPSISTESAESTAPTEITEPTETIPDTESPEEEGNKEQVLTPTPMSLNYPYGRLIYANDRLYSLAFPAWPLDEDKQEIPHKIGEIKKYDYNLIPSSNFSSNYFPVGTEIYQLDDLSCIYLKLSVPEMIEDYWLILTQTTFESLQLTPFLTVEELADMLEGVTSGEMVDELTLYHGNSFTSGFWSYCCELQDAEYYVLQYEDELRLVHLTNLNVYDLLEHSLGSILAEDQLKSIDDLTVAGFILNSGFGVYDDYMDYTVTMSDFEQIYNFSSHNHQFVYALDCVLDTKLTIESSAYDDEAKWICISLTDLNENQCALVFNKAGQLKIVVNKTEYYFECDGYNGYGMKDILECTEKADQYYSTQNLRSSYTYSVFGFDTPAEQNDTPYRVSLTDDNFVYVCGQYGTESTITQAKFYDPTYNRVSPTYCGSSDYYQNMVVAYGVDEYGELDERSVQIFDIFTGEVLCDVYNSPNVDIGQLHFNRDCTAVLVQCCVENGGVLWEVVMLPVELRVNQKVGTNGRKIPQYESVYMREKPWENHETLYMGVPDQQTGMEITQAIMAEKYSDDVFYWYPMYDSTNRPSHFAFGNEKKMFNVHINLDNGAILSITKGTDSEVNLLTTPAITEGETAAKIAEAIRAGWVRQTNRYIPYLSVQKVTYDEVTGYWIVLMYPAVNYPIDMEYYIVLDSKDGHIVNFWEVLG